MIISILILLGKIFGALILVLISIATYSHFKAKSKITRLLAQGMFNYPGNDTFFAGSIGVIGQYFDLTRTYKKRVFPQPMRWIAERIDGEKERQFNSKKYPNVVINHMSKIMTMTSDPQLVSDMFNKQNKKIEKAPDGAVMFKDLLGSSILFGPSDEDWRQKRKACAHAFYKERLHHMIEVLKYQIGRKADQWKAEIAANKDGDHSTQINIAHEFADLFAYNMVHIAFGQDMSDDKFEMEYMPDKETRKFETRLVNIVEALNNIFMQINVMIMTRFENPISLLAVIFFEINLDLAPFCVTVKANCLKIRNFILAYVNKRKQGKVQSSVQNVDMLSLFLESPQIFTDDFIVDELMDFFFAGTITV